MSAHQFFMPPPVALSIAGSDCSAGAGLQADLKTFSAFNVYGLTAVTCVVAEIPRKVSAIQPVDLANLTEQLTLLFHAFPVTAVKTGMLYSAEIIHRVADIIESLPTAKRPHLVVDPVMVATSGDALIRDDAVATYEARLFPLATLITPNMDEAHVLLGIKINHHKDLVAVASHLYQRYGCAVLVKGGHLRTAAAVDILHDARGSMEFSAPYIAGISTHGTGCTYSAAITAGLACGLTLRRAIGKGKKYVSRAIGQAFRWPQTNSSLDALNHFQQKSPR